jgi:hypothetical protein
MVGAVVDESERASFFAESGSTGIATNDYETT